MPPRRQSALALAVTLLLAGGCASSGPFWSQEDQGAAEATELRERVTRLEGQLAAAESQSAALRARADELQREVDRLRLGASPAAGVGALPGDAEEAAPSPAPRPSPEIEQSDLDELDELAPRQAPTAEFPGAAGAAGAPIAQPLDDATDPRALYERSLGLLEQGRLPEAETGFRRFLADNPDSDLADNAQFWLAEAALRRADTATALAGFRAVVENFPEANKVPDALLKVGYCLAELGEAESAMTVYRELVARFPESAAAETARQRLGGL